MGWRDDLRDNFETSLTAFKAANPTLVDSIMRVRREALPDTLTIYIGSITEQIRHDAGTRQRTADVQLVVARHLSDNTEATNDLEDTADALVDWLTTNYGLTGSHTVQEPITSQSTEIDDGGFPVPAVVVVSRALIQQGRF